MNISMRKGLIPGVLLSMLAACNDSSTAVSSSPAQPEKGGRKTQSFTVNVYGISFDGMPIDLDGVQRLDLCSPGQCHTVALEKPARPVTNEAGGSGMLIGRVMLPALELTRVRLYAQGNIGVNATQATLAQPLMLEGDDAVPARVLISLSANWSCGSKTACLVLRGGAAGIREDGQGQYLAYNPNQNLSAKMPEGVGLSIPAGALGSVQLFHVNVAAADPQPRVDILPAMQLGAPAILTLPPQTGRAPQRISIGHTGHAVSGTALAD